MRYSPAEVAAAAGVSTRVLDYWSRAGLVAPTQPSGSYSSREMSLAIVCGHAHRLAVPGEILRAIVGALDGEPLSWPDRLVVDAAGNVSAALDLDGAEPDAGWSIRPRRLLTHSGPQLMLAMSAA